MSTTTTRDACPDPELFTALVDSELDRSAEDALLDHVATCDECATDLAAERRTRAVLVALRDEPLDSAELVPSTDLTARLLAIPASDGQEEAPVAPVRVLRQRRVPAYLGAAASVVVLMVGAFAFIGAQTQEGVSPTSPSRTTAIVPAADRLAEEHALTAVQTGFGGAGSATGDDSAPQIVSVSMP